MADITENDSGDTAETQSRKAGEGGFAQLSPPAADPLAGSRGGAEPAEEGEPSPTRAAEGGAGEADDTERADGAVVDAGDTEVREAGEDQGTENAGDLEGVEGDESGAGEAGAADTAAASGRRAKRPARKGDAEGDEESEESGLAAEDVPLGALEALLLSTHHPLTAPRLAELLKLKSVRPVRRAVKLLNEQYEAGARSFRIEQVAGGYQILTMPEYGEVLKKLHQREADARLTKAALETLSIIAYKQPILRADVEAIRGVACGETIRSLMEKHLVKIAGRAEEPGRPILYGTTRRFLELFGLNSLKDLPQPEGTPKPPGGG